MKLDSQEVTGGAQEGSGSLFLISLYDATPDGHSSKIQCELSVEIKPSGDIYYIHSSVL